MSILDTFYILFDSDASKLDKGLGDSEKKADHLVDKLKGVDKEGSKAGASLYDLIGKGAGLFGVALSIGALVQGVRSTAAAYDELGKLAARFRDTADAVDEFIDASALLGISEETSVSALKSLDSAIQDTFLGMGRAGKVFDELGIEVKDAAGKIKPTTAVMGELAEKFKDMERGTQIRVMERLGLDPALLKLFNADLVALQKRMADVDRASGFNLDMAVKRSAEFTKATKGLTLEVNTLKMYLEKLAEGFKVATMPFFTDAITKATGYVKMFVDFLMKHNKFMEGVFIALGGAILYFLVPAAIKGAIAVWAMIAPFALVALAVAAVIAIFALLYDDIMTFMEGGDSMIGQIVNKWPIIGEIAKGIGQYLKFLWDIGKAVLGFFVDMWNDPEHAFENFRAALEVGFAGLLEAFPRVKAVLVSIGETMVSVGDTVMGVWNAIIATIQAVIDGVMAGINAVIGAAQAAGKFLGIGGETGAGLAAGKSMLGQAGASAMGAQTSNSISNTTQGGRSTSVQVGKVEVKTAATDAEGISKAIGGSMQAQMRQAAANYDDGVLA